jgi:hypothetical protein
VNQVGNDKCENECVRQSEFTKTLTLSSEKNRRKLDCLSAELAHSAEHGKMGAKALQKQARGGHTSEGHLAKHFLRQTGYLLEDLEAKWLTAGGPGLRCGDAKTRKLIDIGFTFVKTTALEIEAKCSVLRSPIQNAAGSRQAARSGAHVR